MTIFRQRFPSQPWRASEPTAKPVLPAVDAEVGVDWRCNQGRHQTAYYTRPLRWMDALFAIALGLVMCAVVASAFGVLTP